MSNAVSKRNRRPVSKGVVDSIPDKTRGGEWPDEFEKWKAAPKSIFHYEEAAPSQGPYLKRRFGVETECRNTMFVDANGNKVHNEDAYQKNEDGTYKMVPGRTGKMVRVKRPDVDQVCDLFVTYDPDTVEANLAAARAANEKAKAKKATATTGAKAAK